MGGCSLQALGPSPLSVGIVGVACLAVSQRHLFRSCCFWVSRVLVYQDFGPGAGGILSSISPPFSFPWWCFSPSWGARQFKERRGKPRRCRCCSWPAEIVIAVCCPCRCLTLEGTARRSAAAEAAITSATEVANTRDGGHGHGRAAASVTVGTVGRTVTMFDPGGECAQTGQDLGPCGVSLPWLEVVVVSSAPGWPEPYSPVGPELQLPGQGS